MRALEARDLWLAELRTANASTFTIDRYRATTNEWLRLIAARHHTEPGNITLDDICRDDVVTAMAAYQTGGGNGTTKTASSVNVFLGAFKSFMAWCVETEKLVRTPLLRIKTPKVPSRIPKALTETECRQLLAACEHTRFPQRDRLAVLLGLTMGLRLNEMVTVTLDSFHPHITQPTHLCVIGKGNKERAIPVPDIIVNALDAYLKERQSLLNAAGLTSQRLLIGQRPTNGTMDATRAMIGQTFTRLINTAGLQQKGRRVHVARHSFATHTLNAGADITAISELLGHSSINTTTIYLRVNPERMTAAVANNPLAHT